MRISMFLFVFFLFFYAFLGCNKEKSPANITGNNWKIYEADVHPEIYGGWITNDDIYYTSGGYYIWSRKNDKAKELYRNSVRLNRLWGDTNDNIWVVGSVMDDGLIVKCYKEKCDDVSRTEGLAFESIHGTQNGLKYISGARNDNGTITGVVMKTSDGVNLDLVYEKEGYYFLDIWCDSLGDTIVVVGRSIGGEYDEGIVVTGTSDNIWKEQPVNTESYIYVSVWGLNEREIYIVGYYTDVSDWLENTIPLSTVYKFDGTALKEVLRVKDKQFMSVWGTSTKELFFGGSKWAKRNSSAERSTCILRWDQSSVSEMTLPASNSFSSNVYGFNFSYQSNRIYAFTNEGIIFTSEVSK